MAMFAPGKVFFGVTPTLWTNDDLPTLGDDIPFEQCVSEMALAGYEGCSVGHKYPADPSELKAALDLRGLRVSEPWASTYFTSGEMDRQTQESFLRQLAFIKEMGGTDIVIAELGHSVHQQPVALLPNKPRFDDGQWRAMVDGINQLFLGWYSFPRPVVCAVNGHAIAGGLILALCGDHRIGSGVGKLGLTELRAGIPYPVAAMAIVRAELAPPAVRVLAMRAELVDSGPEAVELGLLDELAEPDALLDRALEVAHGFAALPRAAYARVKEQLRGETVAALTRVVEEGTDPMLGAWMGEETAAASAAILRRE